MRYIPPENLPAHPLCRSVKLMISDTSSSGCLGAVPCGFYVLPQELFSSKRSACGLEQPLGICLFYLK